jgi:DNA-binding transcriptional ArsR family regulator
MGNLAWIERELRALADAVAAARGRLAGRGEGEGAANILAAAAPLDTRDLIAQVVNTLARRTGDQEGLQVLIAGVQRAAGGYTSTWYELFSDEKVSPLLHNEKLIRLLETLASVERLRLWCVLASGATGSAEAMERSQLSPGQFYHHLRALEGIGMVRKKARDQYQTTLHGTASLFTILAAVSYILSEIPFVEEETP